MRQESEEGNAYDGKRLNLKHGTITFIHEILKDPANYINESVCILGRYILFTFNNEKNYLLVFH